MILLNLLVVLRSAVVRRSFRRLGGVIIWEVEVSLMYRMRYISAAGRRSVVAGLGGFAAGELESMQGQRALSQRLAGH